MADADLVEQTRAIWQDILGATVTGDTDFFWAGGHSFSALDLVGRVAQAAGADVPLRLLFDHPQFEDFVAAVSGLVVAAP